MSNNQKTVRFILRPRRQKDPLIADNEAPQNVLVPADGADIETIKKRLPDFPSELFPSTEETKVGMLERAHNADGVTFDKDLLEAMSKDFDYEDPNNLLDDDFMDQAGGLIEDEGELKPEELKDLFDDDDDEMNMDMNENLEEAFFARRPPANVGPTGAPNRLIHDDEESELDYQDDKSSQRSGCFTNYSMTSSVLPRNKGLQQIDEHFERLFENEYGDDTEIGALDLNEVKGEELLTNIDQIHQLKREVKIVRKRNHGDDYEPEIVSEHHKNAIIGDGPEEDEEDMVEVEIQRRENKIDCESILTYNSNLYNHPKLIVEPRKRTTSTAQSDDQSSHNETRNIAPSIASSRASVLSKLSIRLPNESLEEKRIRKKALKQYRQERRQERKQNREVFKSEQANLMKQQISRINALKLS